MIQLSEKFSKKTAKSKIKKINNKKVTNKIYSLRKKVDF